MSQQQVVLVNAPPFQDSAPDSPVLRIESVTWNRDSHELFDYESRHVFGRKYLLRKPAKLFRSSLEVSVVTDGNDFPQNADYLLSVKAREGKFYIYPADRNVCGPSANIQPRKLWLIIKHLQRSSFPLNEGDVIKLGRFKLRVKQVVTETEGATPVDFKLDDVEVPPTELTIEDAPNMQCRICLLEGGELNDPLVRACQCKGSIMYVHLDCLRHWVNGRLNLAEDPARSCCFVKQIQCELCKSTFPSFVTARGVKLPVVKVPNVQPPFIVLENLVGPTNRGVHLCSMSVKKECKLGRGHESDVRIADVSISRFHAMIKYIDGSFFLEDHGSKFGTLVALRKATMVERVDKLSVQVGRTVLKFSMEENVTRSFTDCLDITDQSDMPNPTSAALELAAQEYAEARGAAIPHIGDAHGADSSMEGPPLNPAQMNIGAMEAAGHFPVLGHTVNQQQPMGANLYHSLPLDPQRTSNDQVNVHGLLNRPTQAPIMGGGGSEGVTGQDRNPAINAAAARLVPFAMNMNMNHLYHNPAAAYSPRMFEATDQSHNTRNSIAGGTPQVQVENRAEGWSPGLGGGMEANVGGNGGRSPQQARPVALEEENPEAVRQFPFGSGVYAQRGFGGDGGALSAVGDASMASRRAAEGAGPQGGADASMRSGELTTNGFGSMVLRRSVWPAAHLVEAHQENAAVESEAEPRVSGVNDGER